MKARFVADEFSPGERRGALAEDVFDGLGDQVERPLGAVQLDLPTLDAGQSGFQRAGQSADAGIAGHDFDQRRGRLELAGHLGDLRHREEQQSVLFKELARTERLDRFEMRFVSRQFFGERVTCGIGEFRRRGVQHSQDRGVAIEGLAELLVALAPIQILRNQRVDVGVDRKMPGCVEAGPYRKDECEQDRGKGKACAGSNN
jgi:hypothetical protein